MIRCSRVGRTDVPGSAVFTRADGTVETIPSAAFSQQAGRLSKTSGIVFLLLGAISCAQSGENGSSPSSDLPPVAAPNDNRSPAGTLRDGVLDVEIVAREARWAGEPSDLDPEAEDPETISVLAFAEAGGAASIPGPLIRVPQGTEVRLRVRNSLPDSVVIGLPGPGSREPEMSSIADSILVVRGLRAGTVLDDTLYVRRGEVREIRYRADIPGTYLYWGTPSNRSLGTWTGRDAQLAGAIVVDPPGATPNPDERIFVITMVDQYAEEGHPAPQDELFRRAINGLSWPETEGFQFAVGDTVRWRWVNATFEFHPMHLHGFHYRVLARGDGTRETRFTADRITTVVTEMMSPGSTFVMEWVPARAGNWIFHCHFLDHITPVVARDEAARMADVHDPERHAVEAMAGLVIGITVRPDPPAVADDPPARRLRLLARERPLSDSTMTRGFVLYAGAEPPADSVVTPGPPLVLTRGETTEITVVNRLTEPTTIHWHGLELESVYDGVAGWSRTGSRIAPLITPGDSFSVRIRPPRAGTFIYHTHMDETDQLAQGMIGPFVVLEPGEEFDPETDRLFVIGGQGDGPYPLHVNGHTEPAPARFETGHTYRLRFIHITRGVTLGVSLRRNGEPVRWTTHAKDGADLPAALRTEALAEFETHTGETFDFMWTPTEPGDRTLTLWYDPFFGAARSVEQVFRVH